MLHWMRYILTALCLASVGFVSSHENQQAANAAPGQVQAVIIPEDETIQPGHPFWVIVQLHIQDKWHSYWKNPGDAGMATSIEWNLPEGFTASPIKWPTPERFTLDSMIGYGYEGDVSLLTQITPPPLLPMGKDINIGAKVRWLVCSDSACVPGESEISAKLPTVKTHPIAANNAKKLFANARTQLPKEIAAVQAYLHDNRYEMQLPIPANNISSAYFCPEDKHVIDHTAEAVLTPSPDNPQQYTVSLKQAQTPSDQDSLRGVLVVNSEPGHSHAVELNAPIISESGGEEYIGYMEDVPQSNLVEQAGLGPVANDPVTLEGGLAMALLLAFIGGMILNLMPCVLPVISLKVFSFVKLAGKSRTLTLQHGFAFAAGVLISFWALASILLMLKAYGHAVGWGFQLQEPIFVGILAAILLVLSLSLFGVFEFGTSLTSLAGKAQSHAANEGPASSFFSGILATAVATPCTGPFLGSAIGFAFTVSATKALLIFTALGLGMAFPYILLAAFPSLLRFLPKPGPWMITFKEIMGFFMLATVLWLVWVFGAQTGSLPVLILLASFFLLALACWIYGKWGSPVKPFLSRIISSAIALILLAAAGTAIFVSAKSTESPTEQQQLITQAGEWEAFSPQRVAELQKQGVPVLIDFTAKWCLICQVNHLVLTSDKVEQKLNEHGVVRMKADWTKNDPVITEELRKHGRNGVPLYVLYTGEEGKTPKILPQVLTPDNVIAEVNTM